MRMSYSGNTLAFQANARGSIPLIRFISYIRVLELCRLGKITDSFVLSPRIPQR